MANFHQGREYLDDRIFIVELRRTVEGSSDSVPWVVTTRRNVRGRPYTRADDFATWDSALAFIRKILPETPHIQFEGKPNPNTKTYDEYSAWLDTEGLPHPFIHPDD